MTATDAKALTYERVWTVEGYHEVEELQQAIWTFDRLDAVPLHMLLTAHKNGGLLLGAREPGGGLVGFVFGFVGRQDGRLRHCSHMAGVVTEWQHGGVGERLKWLQADAVREQGLDLVTWTFDPLQAPNANLNFRKLAGVSRTYTVNLYGAMTDNLNQGSDSDRLTVEWWIDGERVRRRRLGVETLPTFEQYTAQGAETVLRAAPDGTPEAGPVARPDVALVEIPADFGRLKTEAPETAQAWRRAVREALRGLFEDGWAVVDFVRQSGPAGRRGYYVLQRDEAAGLPPRLKV